MLRYVPADERPAVISDVDMHDVIRDLTTPGNLLGIFTPVEPNILQRLPNYVGWAQLLQDDAAKSKVCGGECESTVGMPALLVVARLQCFESMQISMESAAAAMPQLSTRRRQ